MKCKTIFLLLPAGIYLAACTTPNKDVMQQSRAELVKIDSLLRSPEYSLEMAKALETAYQVSEGQTPDHNHPGWEQAPFRRSLKEEKIATNLAGFYALECGIGALCEKTGKKPTDILTGIVTGTVDSGSVLLLNRFANATWKAGQPFRSLERITRPIFSVANFLSAEEIKKDYDQVSEAARQLLSAMEDVKNGNTKEQMQKLKSLLQNEEFAYKMATALDQYYYTSQNQTPPPPENDTATISKNAKEQGIATNIAGFYALECGTSYFVTTRNDQPSAILRSIVDNTISKEDKMLLARFANATWKAGQPFRGLDRITRETFTPFYFLSESDIEKDLVQIRAAAKKLLESL